MGLRIGLALLVFCSVAASAATPQIDAIKPGEADSAKANRDMMIGRWFGDAPTKEGGRRMHIVDRFPDGTMRIDFRLIGSSGEIREQTEVAFWGISRPVYFTMTQGWLDGEEFRPADTTQAYFYDAYEVLELSEESFRYRSFSTGNEYKIKKVGPEFDFPE